ncbi:hypothetical protein TSUD_138640 [Trifolium subterraneum]|uniref:Uncharacterized protein n=1 Tax=Trifolium subterraneum TaxID=3900 RepID=A0A2Z6MHB4_TRISU|nr:hypothetical protein TSUD_138640 [Trifolium subterraneum]
MFALKRTGQNQCKFSFSDFWKPETQPILEQHGRQRRTGHEARWQQERGDNHGESRRWKSIDGNKVRRLSKDKSGDANAYNVGKEGFGFMEGVQVGDIVVRIGAQQDKAASKKVQEKELEPITRKMVDSVVANKDKDTVQFVRLEEEEHIETQESRIEQTPI